MMPQPHSQPHPQHKSADWRTKASIIYITGPPGTGKATQASLLAKRHSNVIAHIALHNLLETSLSYQPVNKSKYHANAEQNMRAGKTSSKEFCVDLLRYQLVQGIYKDGKNVFLLEGFPVNLAEANLFESKICAPTVVINLTCAEEDAVPRLVERGCKDGMRYDSASSILGRMEKFEAEVLPVVEHYAERGFVRDVDAGNDVEEVYWEIRAVLAEEGVVIVDAEG
ncbi:P-loop containing nucleoside triphosphate hydrolase protein [Aspergillus oleicola]